MAEPQFYFVPITATAVLFAANGLIKERNLFNVVLGAELVGVLLRNLDDYGPLHNVLAIAFFGGNIMMILLTSSRTWYRALTGIGAALVVLYISSESPSIASDGLVHSAPTPKMSPLFTLGQSST